METKSYEQIYNTIKNYVIAHQNKITDFTEGSVVMSIAEAVSRVIDSLYLNAKIGFSSYIRGLPYSVFNFRALMGTRASGHVVFSRSEIQDYSTVVSVGTSVAAGSFIFTTTEKAIIPAGERDSQPVMVSADDIGIAYNIEAGEISTINGAVPNDVDSVTNPESMLGGSDKELWSDFVVRFNQYINGLQNTNENGIKTLLTKDGLCRSVGIVEHFPMLNDIYNATIYVEDGSGGMTPNGLDMVQKRIDGDGTADYPMQRAIGLNYIYMPPKKKTLSFEIKVTLNAKKAVDIAVETLNKQLYEVTRDFVNNMRIGQNYYPADLITIFKSNGYVNDVVIDSPKEIILENADTIFRFNSAHITFTMS